MPFYPSSQVVNRMEGPLNEPPSESDPTFGQIVGASFRGQPTVSAITAIGDLGGAPDPAFDPYALQDPMVDRFPRAFTDVVNRPQFEARKARIARDEADNQIRAAAPVKSFATDFVLGMADPTSWVPVVGQGARLARLGMAGRAAVGAGVGLQGAAVGEAVLQASQPTRRLEDVPGNLGFGALFGAALGPAVGALGARAERRAAASRPLAGAPVELGGVIRTAAERHRQDPKTLATIAKLESNFDPGISNPRSSAAGLFQFIDQTWAAYGEGNRLDPAAASDAAARLLADNRAALAKTLGRDPEPWELYLAHQQGAGGAEKLLANPQARAADLVGADAVKLNGGNASMTAGEFAGLWRERYAAVGGGGGTRINAVTREALLSKLAKAETDYHMTPDAVESPDAYASIEETMAAIPAAARDAYQAHGTDLNGALSLLRDGIDQSREFHSGPLIPGEHGIDTTRLTMPVVFLSEPGKSVKETGIRYAVLNGPATVLRSDLQRIAPDVVFMTSDEAATAIRTGNFPAAVHASAINAVARNASDQLQRQTFGDWTTAPRVFDDVRAKLTDAGRPLAEAEDGGKLWASHFSAMAVRTGKDADDLYSAVGLGGDPVPAGAIDIADSATVVNFFAGADASTFAHESGNFFLSHMQKLAESPDGPGELKADWKTARAWLGHEGDAPLSREAQEQWARGFEAYLHDGKAPTLALQDVFDRFAGWLRAIYRTVEEITGGGPELSGDVRGVMDRLLSHEADPGRIVDGGGSGGSAFARGMMSGSRNIDDPMADLRLVAEPAARVLARAPIIHNPALDLRTSSSREARIVGMELADSTALTHGNVAGIPSALSVQGAVDHIWRPKKINSDIAARRDFADYAKAAGMSMVNRLRHEGDFFELVGRYMRRGDSAEELIVPQGADAFLSRAAKRYRQQAVDPLAERARQPGPGGKVLLSDAMMEAPLKTATSYFTRLYDRPRIRATLKEFTTLVLDGFKRVRDADDAALAETAAARSAAEGDLTKLVQQAMAAAPEQAAFIRDGKGAAPDTSISGQAERAAETLKRLAKPDADEKAIARRIDRLAAQERQARRDATRLQAGVERAAARERKFSEPKTPAEVSGVIDTIRHPPKEPPSLLTFLRSKGGLKDAGGELAARDAATSRLLNEKSGMHLDEATRAADDAGYFGVREGERIAGDQPTIDDLLAAVDAELGGRKQYSEHDAPVLAAMDAYDDARRWWDENTDLPLARIKGKSNRDVFAAMEGRKPLTAGARAKGQEAGRGARDFGARLTTVRAEGELASQKLAGARDELRIAKELRARNDTSSRALTVVAKKVRTAERTMKDESRLAGVEDAELETMAVDTINRILGDSTGRTGVDLAPAERGPAKERVLTFLSDKELEPWLISDPRVVLDRYVNTLAPDVELFHRYGSVNGQEAIDRIGNEFDRLIASAATPKEASRLQAEKKRQQENATGIIARLRHTFWSPRDANDVLLADGAAVIKAFSVATNLGNIVFSSMADATRAIFVHGLMTTFSDGLIPVIRNVRLLKLSRDVAREAGAGNEMGGLSLQMKLAEMGNEYGEKTRVQRATDAAAAATFRYTGFDAWNEYVQVFAGVVTQSQLIKTVEKLAGGGKVDPLKVARLAKYGIGVDEAKVINRQLKAWGSDVGGARIADPRRWSDPRARNFYLRALGQELHEIMIKPGQEKPFWLSKPLGSVLGQFQTFGISSMERTVLAGIQRAALGDMSLLSGVIAAVGAGMFGYYLKAQLGGWEMSDDPAEWIWHGVSESGLLGYGNNVNRAIEAVSHGTLGMSAALGHPPLNKYAAASRVGALLGPGAGVVSDVLTVGGKITSDLLSDAPGTSLDSSDVHRARKLVPWNGMLWFRFAFDEAELGVKEALGIPQRQTVRR